MDAAFVTKNLKEKMQKRDMKNFIKKINHFLARNVKKVTQINIV